MSLDTPEEMARRLHPTRDAPGFDVANERRKIAAEAIRTRDEAIRADMLADAQRMLDDAGGRLASDGASVVAALRAYAAKLGGAP